MVGDEATEVVADDALEDGGDNDGLRLPATFAKGPCWAGSAAELLLLEKQECGQGTAVCAKGALFCQRVRHASRTSPCFVRNKCPFALAPQYGFVSVNFYLIRIIRFPR